MSIHSNPDVIGWGLLGFATPGVAYLTALTAAALWRKPRPEGAPLKGRIAFVVPAHNEESGILKTLVNLAGEATADGDCEVVVIADNCTDRTATIAEQAGARVIERTDQKSRGKGYALDFAFRTLEKAGYVAYVVIDADSEVEPGFLAQIRDALGHDKPAAQARYLARNARGSQRERLMELALAGWNVVRPRGRACFGVSVGILGNGFALRRSTLDAVPYSATSVVEDMEYHLKLVARGLKVAHADKALVRGEMPTTDAAATTQRSRWEGGRLQIARQQFASLLYGLIQGRLELVDPILDLMLLPLAMQVLVVAAATILIWDLPALIYGVSLLGLIGAHVLVSIHIAKLPATALLDLLLVPKYLFWKLRRLPQIAAGASASSNWLRTPRNVLEGANKS